MSNSQAVVQLLGMFGILGCVMTFAYAIDDKLRPVAPRWVHGYPVDMHSMHGLDNVPVEGKSASNQKRVAMVLPE